MRKGSKMHISILALYKIPTYSKQNIYLDQWNECSKTGKQKCIVIQRTFSTVGRQILSILAIIVYNTYGTAFMQVELSITDKIVYHRILYFRGFWECLCNNILLSKNKRFHFDQVNDAGLLLNLYLCRCLLLLVHEVSTSLVKNVSLVEATLPV